jgi:hypothetical protein
MLGHGLTAKIRREQKLLSSSIEAEDCSMMTTIPSVVFGSVHYIFVETSRNGPSALSIAVTAWKIAFPFENEVPVLVLMSSNCTVHRQPLGLAVCTT